MELRFTNDERFHIDSDSFEALVVLTEWKELNRPCSQEKKIIVKGIGGWGNIYCFGLIMLMSFDAWRACMNNNHCFCTFFSVTSLIETVLPGAIMKHYVNLILTY